MEFVSNLTDFTPTDPVRVGNVYPIKGGRGLKQRHMQILLAITEGNEWQGRSCLFLVVSKEGKPVGVNQYAMHYVEELMPMGFVAGLEDMNLEINSL
ncbi:hypothetical protein [Sinorhizobium sp. M4_45]|uniref:hypothetical protein n=1 Tax=Sinorhizobium sp. M4_45 TaxID=2037901 RepID=UPI000C9C29C1|nr:hypothetical protein [Sinorhizobium sp. M4_45]PND29027.1 hypothetical protein CN933_02880 [Sinorhizobium sp. M4_45]